MSTLHRLKAYFGMVPADELDDYGHYTGQPGTFGPHQDDDYEVDYDGGHRSRLGGRPSRWAGQDTADHDGHSGGRAYDDYYDDEPEPPARRAPVRRQWAADAPVRGALAVDPAREPRASVAPVEAASINDGHPMSRITTLHPRSFTDAITIGEHYRDGIPVIINLTTMEDADARRLVDFAAGLAFALRGSIDKVTTKVFLISPANVDVTAEDKRRIAEGNFLPSHFKHS